MLKSALCLRAATLAAGALLLTGCLVIGDADEPLATIEVRGIAHDGPRAAVVILPGFGHGAELMLEKQLPAAIHRAWPEIDVVLTSATFAYYTGGVLVERLRREVIGPLREAGYASVWLAGASMGGLGVTLYERHHPGELDGLVLFAPFLGDDAPRAVAAAGGVRAWSPGPVPAAVHGDNFEVEAWRQVRRWATDPDAARRVWLTCGREDRLLETARLVAPALPQGHYLEVAGGHTWDVWITMAESLFRTIRSSQVVAASAPAGPRRPVRRSR